jgi:hypothetical protein
VLTMLSSVQPDPIISLVFRPSPNRKKQISLEVVQANTGGSDPDRPRLVVRADDGSACASGDGDGVVLVISTVRREALDGDRWLVDEDLLGVSWQRGAQQGSAAVEARASQEKKAQARVPTHFQGKRTRSLPHSQAHLWPTGS